MPKDNQTNSERVDALERALHVAWTGLGSTPFVADIRLPEKLLAEARHVVRKISLRQLFLQAPTLATWAVLYPLAKSYGTGTRDVYAHIAEFVGEDLSDSHAREALKRDFRRHARAIGLPVVGNLPTELFFAPLGPAHTQHEALARALVGASAYHGPPATEDTSSARRWQRLTVAERCPGLTRLQASVDFDRSAHIARRFEAWRKGDAGHGEGEKHLFAAYDAAARELGRSRSDLVGPPRLVWLGDRIGVEAESSRLSQSLLSGAFPVALAGGKRIGISEPWPDVARWRAEAFHATIAVAPRPGEVLAFDADSGALLARVAQGEGTVELAAQNIVLLAAEQFSSPSFGDAIEARDPRYRLAWVSPGETLSFAGRPDLTLSCPREASAWIAGTALGRDGSRVLYPSEGELIIRIDPEIGGNARILRIRHDGGTRFVPFDVPAEGLVRLDFRGLGFHAPGAPGKVLFDVLAPGAAGDLEARAEISTQAWIWPGLARPTGDLVDAPVPSNFDPARSAGLVVLDGRVSVDPRSEVETSILGLRGPEGSHEFHLAARSEKLWHCRLLEKDRVFVPRGAVLILGHDNRHDTLQLRSFDRGADLLVLGRERRRAFLHRDRLELGAAELEPQGTEDDRIALRRADGRVEVLARLRRSEGAGEISFTEDGPRMSLSLRPGIVFDAIRIRIESADGTTREGELALGHKPADLGPLPGLQARRDEAHLELTLESSSHGPARARFFLRGADGALHPLRDSQGVDIALGLPGLPLRCDATVLTRLAAFLAEPVPEALGGQLIRALSPAYETVFTRLGAARMVGSVRAALALERTDGGVPQHDLAGVAPWIFEASAAALSSLPPASGLAPLSLLGTTPAPAPPPALNVESPLVGWLDRVSLDDRVPEALDADALRSAFRTLRSRLRGSDFRNLVGEGALASSVRVICETRGFDLDQIRSFDAGGGADPMPARIALQIERHARACAEGRAEEFIDRLVFRSGLPRYDVGQATTLMLRAGIEIFVYFRALWGCAVCQEAQHDDLA